MKHTCNKESEIAEMHTDIKWIRNQMSPLLTEVRLNSRFRIESLERGRIVRYAVGSGWFLTLCLLLYNVIL